MHPNVHPRRAYVCGSPGCCAGERGPVRVFLQPGDPEPPECPEHGGTMRLQANLPYTRPDTAKPVGKPRAVASGRRKS
jgi:hypothetical protein